jgi:molybdenum-dependent DNA-binding transcriptional regulator ModE
VSFPNIPTSEEARIRGQKGRESYARKREAKKIALWREIVRGEPLKRAAHNVGISYTTARQYRSEA